MKKLPVVAIIGRPNVGKSTLFNKLIRQKKAIVADKPGVTRDKILGTVEWDGKYFHLIDTGGITFDQNDSITEQVKKQIEIASNEADLILFLTDYKNGITGDDLNIAKWAKKLNKNIILVVNKIDSKELLPYASEFYALGFKDTFFISAINSLNISELLDAILSKIKNVSTAHIPYGNTIPISILGKPNVGKSTLINKIAGKEISIVSEIPGTTRDSVDLFFKYKNNIFQFIDTAGLRKKTKIKDNIEFYSLVRTIRYLEQSQIALFLLDSNQGLTSLDIEILEQIHENNKGLIVLLNKWDILEDKDDKSFIRYKEYLSSRLSYLKFVPIISISALTGLRVAKIFDTILYVYENYNKKIPTSFLNNTLEKIIKNNPPPVYRGKEIKFYYITQIGTAPPHFIIFSNYPEQLSDTYKRYLTNQLYEALSLEGIFFKISFKKRERINKTQMFIK